MGLRSRLRHRIKKALGSDGRNTPVTTPGGPEGSDQGEPTSAARPNPAKQSAPESAPRPVKTPPAPAFAVDSPSAAAADGGENPSTQAVSKGTEGEEAIEPAASRPAEPSERTDPTAAKAGEPAQRAQASERAPGIAVAQVFASDYATDDAPVRNAHYADVFETTEQAMLVRVHAVGLGLDATFPVEPGEFVLDAAERAGHELPFSCRSGGCLSCSARLEEGATQMDEQYVLEEEHIEAGYRLLCLTTVEAPCVFETDVQEEIE